MISVIFIGIASVINSLVLECLGKTDIDLYGEERGGKYRSIDKRVAREGKLYNAQEEFITPDGIHHNTIVSKNIINNDIQEIREIPEDNPSRPSIKLIALVIPTIQNKVTTPERNVIASLGKYPNPFI